ncbi:enterobacterial EspB family protein [Yersinia rohdei]|uniref:Enterobacterial EspB family protein n=1 Tax=Yersinia rohdei TaxID=29485 RepID=A0A0U1HRX2_YERRO|nr:methyl-accepting chemotaxis protein [Yersinia rohdei]AJJ12567.1 enterobacterial EspB family protein [Yersinia rohdei]EEQ01638.1 Methyl-accepting chemotaxis protein [Yersinia rohdei ATCC 43380]MDN0093159.1 chemotaxis protein [Yersinia rohdei]CNE33319.1 methyl-accepting chemotaxis protein [Yersinia rohdei]CQI89548.1 methyl-accepting chemotaxis protein [Yersinia rohdei]
MNITVNDKMAISEQAPVSNSGASESGGGIKDIMSYLSDVIFQMNVLFKKMRNLMNTYNQKQQELGWKIQVSSMSNRREAIDKTASGAIASGACSIISGVVGGIGAGASIEFGDIASHASNAFGQLSTGSGKLVEGDMARNSDLLRMSSDLQNSGAQSYNKNISELFDKTNEARNNMKDLGNTINNMIGQIAMTVKL